MAEHRNLYKNSGLDSKELRRRREEDSIQLRKQKRQDVLSKRRTYESPETTEQSQDNSSDIRIHDQQNSTISKEALHALNQNEDEDLLIEYAQKIRRMLSKEPQPPFDEVIKHGLVPRFVELLSSHNPTIQFEIAWCLTNICSGTSDQTQKVVSYGAVQKLVPLVDSPDIRVCEQAVWALGNIIGDVAEFRDLVIREGFVPKLSALVSPDLEIGFLRTVTWVIVNLCRTKTPPPDIEVIKQVLPALCFLVDMNDLSILTDTSWAISYITELGPDYSQLVIDSGLVVKITPLLSHKEIKIQTAVIRALGSIVTGNEDQTQSVIDAGALPHLSRILKESKDRIVKEALWFLSNITAGSREQIKTIIDTDLLPSMIHHLENGDFASQKEAAWAIYNFCLSGSPAQIQCLVDENVLPPLCNLLSLKETNVVRNILETISIILSHCYDSMPNITEIIEGCGGLDRIEELQSDGNEEIYSFAYSIIDRQTTGRGSSAWADDFSDDFDESDTSRLLANSNTPTYRATEEQHLRNHEEGLDRLGQTITRQKIIAHGLADEVDLHNEILDNIETGLDNAIENTAKNTRNIKRLSKKSSTCFLWSLIVVLAIVIVLLAIL